MSSDASTATANLQDVKELIPEFYYLPGELYHAFIAVAKCPERYFAAEFLVNLNGYNLGTTSEGVRLDNVELPPWAHGCPKEFIRLHR